MVDKLDQLFGFQEKALQLRSQRHQILASNIANADTPNYKARDVKFSKVLEDVANNSLSATSALHMSTVESAQRNGIMYRIPLNNSFDGNTVEMNIEQAQFGQAAGDYQATLNILGKRINTFKRAFKGE